MKNLGLTTILAAAVLANGCGSASEDGGSVSATIGGVSWQAPGRGYIIADPGPPTSFDLLGGTPLPGSNLIDSSKPRLTIVFPSGIPAVGTYPIDGVTVNVEYQRDTNSFYADANGSVQIMSISNARAQGAFNFQLHSPIFDPMELTVTDGAFDVPVSSAGNGP